ncbi:hypothetical protein R1sor_009477 [Riccia sorocarpa]|uniref:Uncharacterized protein n=1 Tax=Riccia sorocarpa TaxID=122646 RepID=A0ABD3HWS6_9MARC
MATLTRILSPEDTAIAVEQSFTFDIKPAVTNYTAAVFQGNFVCAEASGDDFSADFSVSEDDFCAGRWQQMLTFEIEPPVEDCAAAAKNIDSFRKGLRSYTECLTSCYTKSNNSHPKLRAIRSQIVHNTKMYRTQHLKASASFITGLVGVMMNYSHLSIDEFAGAIYFIAEGAAVYAVQAALVKDLHLSVKTDTEELIETARMIADDLSGDLHAEKPIMNRVMTLLKDWKQGVDERSLKKSASLPIMDRKQVKAEESMFPSEDIAVSTVAGVNDHIDAGSFKNRAETALRTNGKQDKQLHEEMKNHYNLMKWPAASLVDACDDFLAFVPLLDRKLKAICSEEETELVYAVDAVGDDKEEPTVANWLQMTQLQSAANFTENEERPKRITEGKYVQEVRPHAHSSSGDRWSRIRKTIRNAVQADKGMLKRLDRINAKKYTEIFPVRVRTTIN